MLHPLAQLFHEKVKKLTEKKIAIINKCTSVRVLISPRTQALKQVLLSAIFALVLAFGYRYTLWKRNVHLAQAHLDVLCLSN